VYRAQRAVRNSSTKARTIGFLSETRFELQLARRRLTLFNLQAS
jgi:hypothetical protein